MLCHQVQGFENGRLWCNGKHLIAFLADHISDSRHGCSPLVESGQSIDSFPYSGKLDDNFARFLARSSVPTRKLEDILSKIPETGDFPKMLRAKTFSRFSSRQVQVLIVSCRLRIFDEIQCMGDRLIRPRHHAVL